MPNVFWYALLAILSIIVFIYTLIKTKDKMVVVLYTFISGLTYVIEYFILVIFQSYLYNPDVFKNNYLDNIFGAFLSDAFTVPMVGAFVGAFKLHWRWCLLIAGVFFLIEEWFLHLHIYFQFWWKGVYTVAALFSCFLLAIMWFKVLHSRLNTAVRYISLFMVCMLFQSSVIFLLVAIFHVYHYEIGWFSNPVRDHVAFATAYILFYSFVFSLLVTFRVKWLWRIIVVILTLPLNWYLLKVDILQMSHYWSLYYFVIFRLGILFILDWFNRSFLVTTSGK